jgi:hypothetical protein
MWRGPNQHTFNLRTLPHPTTPLLPIFTCVNSLITITLHPDELPRFSFSSSPSSVLRPPHFCPSYFKSHQVIGIPSRSRGECPVVTHGTSVQVSKPCSIILAGKRCEPTTSRPGSQHWSRLVSLVSFSSHPATIPRKTSDCPALISIDYM